MKMTKLPSIQSFDLPAGRSIAGKYEVERKLGGGYEGEVYKVTERRTGISRAAKLFFPQRNERDLAVKFYARKLDRLSDCPIVVQYHHTETIQFRRIPVTCLISQFVEGDLLPDFLRRQRGNRLPPFEALHLTYALAKGLEQVHRHRDYHGDLHEENVLIKRRGITFDVKLLDFYNQGSANSSRIKEDVIDLVRLLYESVGGKARYASQPLEIKGICRGLRRDLISKSFPNAGALREYLETFVWSSS